LRLLHDEGSHNLLLGTTGRSWRLRNGFRQRFEAVDDDRRDHLVLVTDAPCIAHTGCNTPIIQIGQPFVVVSCPIDMTSWRGRTIIHGYGSDTLNKSVNVVSHVKRRASEVRGRVL
jgi:hypothetical protein